MTLRDPNFLHTETFEVIPGAEQKFIAVFNDWKKEVEAKAPNCGWIMLEILVGGPKTTFQLLWGDCLSQNKIKPLDTYLIEKSAIGSIVRKLSSEDRSFLPNLSTSALDMAKIEIKK